MAHVGLSLGVKRQHTRREVEVQKTGCLSMSFCYTPILTARDAPGGALEDNMESQCSLEGNAMRLNVSLSEE